MCTIICFINIHPPLVDLCNSNVILIYSMQFLHNIHMLFRFVCVQ